MNTALLVVPKHTVDVEIRDARGRVRKVELFLAGDETTAPKERLQDLLQLRRFIPARTPGSGEAHTETGDLRAKIEFLSREHVLWVRLDLMTAIDELDLEAESAAESVNARVSLALDDGTTLEGVLRYLLPSGARRLGDYLEGLSAYFPLRTDDHLYLVRRDRVVAVSSLQEGSR
jgi:hypothetical protein